jgi:glucose/arabinose dehydrogenase
VAERGRERLPAHDALRTLSHAPIDRANFAARVIEKANLVKHRVIVIASLLATPTLCAIACTTGTHQGVGGLGTGDDGGQPDAPVADGRPDADATSQGDTGGGQDGPTGDELPIDIDARPPPGAFCALPGSVVFTQQGPEVVPGSDASTPDLGWLSLPVGFCAHYFGTVQMARQLSFAPDGHLFVASPSAGTTGGSNNGLAEIVILPDDNQDGLADSNITYLGMLTYVQGLFFGGGYLYFQSDVQATIDRVPFTNGDLSPSAATQTFTTIPLPQDTVHWTKVIDVAQDGTMYVTNGSSQSEACLSTRPPTGTINKVSPDGGTTVVAKGFRNPISLRCEKNHDVCLVTELALDYSSMAYGNFGREKLLPVRQGDDWGYPCCATQNTVYRDPNNNQVPLTYADTHGSVDCSGVSAEPVSFVIGETPFAVEVEESGKWPASYGDRAYVAMHGTFGGWVGARLLSITLDANGMPLAASDLDGGESANMTDFATGWDDGHQDHGRPGTITFAPDGRMFVGNDQNGMILWIAPVSLKP